MMDQMSEREMTQIAIAMGFWELFTDAAREFDLTSVDFSRVVANFVMMGCAMNEDSDHVINTTVHYLNHLKNVPDFEYRISELTKVMMDGYEKES